MEWKYGFSATYFATVVDPISWRDTERFEITGGSISRSLSNLMESADIGCVGYPQGVERYIRIYLDARQNGDNERTALFTGLAIPPEREIDGRLETNSVQCYSVLKAAEDIPLELGDYAPTGVDGAELIKHYLSVMQAPIEIDCEASELKRPIIAEKNENHLTMAIKILEAIDKRLKISGMGVVTICEKAETPNYTLDAVDFDIVEPQLSITPNWYSCPNVFRATVGDTMGIARDDDPNSRLSTVNRGREVWMTESDCKLEKNETIGQYARRRLKEEQQSAVVVNYDRRFIPDLYVSDLVELHYPEQDLVGVYTITSQNIEIGYGARTSEEVERIEIL